MWEGAYLQEILNPPPPEFQNMHAQCTLSNAAEQNKEKIYGE